MNGPSYQVKLTLEADEDLNDLKAMAPKAIKAIAKLRQRPTIERLVDKLHGSRALKFSLPGGEHRAAYVIDEERREVVVYLVGPRENFYRQAERRYAALQRRKDQ